MKIYLIEKIYQLQCHFGIGIFLFVCWNLLVGSYSFGGVCWLVLVCLVVSHQRNDGKTEDLWGHTPRYPAAPVTPQTPS